MATRPTLLVTSVAMAGCFEDENNPVTRCVYARARKMRFRAERIPFAEGHRCQ
jgi:hypothetical protein